MNAPYEQIIPIHQQYLDGHITLCQYAAKLLEIAYNEPCNCHLFPEPCEIGKEKPQN